MIAEHLSEFAGFVVERYDGSKPLNPDAAAFVGLDWEQYEKGIRIDTRLSQLVDDPAASSLKALLMGPWDFEMSGGAPAEWFTEHAAKLPALRALFHGEITFEEQEISWIQQTDVTPLFTSMPALEELRVRGGTGLALSPVRHEALKTLVFEAGGLPADVVQGVAGLELPTLDHLELWLGTPDYQGDASAADIAKVLQAKGMPKLRHLGLRNAANADGIMQALVDSGLPESVGSLDLSMGCFNDTHVERLLSIPRLRSLRLLNLDENYFSDAAIASMSEAGLRVVSRGQKAPDEYDGETYYYVSVGE